MSAVQIREELHQFIEEADDRMLSLIYGLLQADKQSAALTPEQLADLNLRVARHKSGQSKSFTWAEARAKILKAK
jgi:hypothetical protein